MNYSANCSMRRILNECSKSSFISISLKREIQSYFSHLITMDDIIYNFQENNPPNSNLLTGPEKEFIEWECTEFYYEIKKNIGKHIVYILNEFSSELKRLKQDKTIIIIISLDDTIKTSVTARFYQDRGGHMVNIEDIERFEQPVLLAFI